VTEQPQTQTQQGDIRLTALTKRYNDVVAVDALDLHIPPGEFFTLVGPSG